MDRLNEVVVVDGIRTPIGRSGWKGMEKQGAFSRISAQHLLATVLKALVDRVKAKSAAFDPSEIEDVAVGCGIQIGEQGMNVGRQAVIAAGLPDEIPGCTVNRFCNSGLQAISFEAQALMTGCGEIAIAAGLQHMSHYPMGADLEAAIKAGYPVTIHPVLQARGVMKIAQGMAAEMIADRYGFSRNEMDEFGLWSHQKAVIAMRDEEEYRRRVIPIEVETDGKELRLVDRDETPMAEYLDNPEAARERMKQLEPRFKENGKITVASSSRITDGAAAVMLMTSEKAEKLGLDPMVKFKTMAVAGSDPIIMLLGPIPAMRKAFQRARLTMDDIGVFETNEAFASPVLAQCKEFGIAYNDARINPTGGAIAIGHPTGCSGVLYFVEMAHWMLRHNIKYGLHTLCGGGGVGIAAIVEKA